MNQRKNEDSSDDVIVFSGVTKSFGTYNAVSNIHINVHRGEIFGFLGPNGAGKTTTIRMLLDSLRPTSGSIQLFGEPNTSVASTHRLLGYLSGDMVLDENLTGKQYLDFVSHVYGIDCQERMIQLAEQLQANLHVKIGNYSRGNKQKIGLIGALMHNPKLLVLDEPTSGFDPLVQETFATLLLDYKAAGGTVFMSSHILSEVQELCDRLAFIKDGKIITTTTTRRLTAQAAKKIKISAADEVIRSIRASHPIGLKLEASRLPQELAGTYSGEIQPLLQFLTTHYVRDVTIREQELEEIFMHYYQHDTIDQSNQNKESKDA